MKIVSLNVSGVKTITTERRAFTTGIYKEPIADHVMLRTLNIDGDKQADLKAHGGPYKAVYVYSADHYPFWAGQLSRKLPYGTFGENLTVSGVNEKENYVGDVFTVGTGIIQVTQPRVPCFKLAHKIGEPTFVKTFMAENRTGFYARVLQEGEIGPGDTLVRTEIDDARVSIHAIFHLLYKDQQDRALAERAYHVEALAPGWKGSMREILAQWPR